MIVMLNIFSHTFWLFVCLIWEKSLPKVSPFLNEIVCFLLSFIKYKYGKIFLKRAYREEHNGEIIA